MLNTAYTYWRWEKALSKEFCNLVIQETDWAKKEQGIAGGILDKKIRATDIVWMHKLAPISCVAVSYINSANTQAGWNYDLIDIEQVQIGRYDKGGHYDWHTDEVTLPKNDLNTTNKIRKISISIQLNDPNEYEGGNLEFKVRENVDSLKMQQGDIIVFPSFVEHRVTPVTEGARYSAVTWASGPPYR